ncbi:S9 family peptidase [Conexibacter sp. DBS9H8]|uniref:alpha/beta hydrolase family protein n=1 Tax=Conexibacter sp. DBS9H8 TaxID=2937801 RepID=UPI00200BAC1A|nr:prolyl oligopeptidase family serine peptidase [Conexibacter sp. DBS9H8]
MSTLDRLTALTAWADRRGPAGTRHAYGPEPDQHATLRLPAGPGPHPVAVLLHGGFWRVAYGAEIMSGLAVGLAEIGWASWNVEYRRGDGAAAAAAADVEAARVSLERHTAPLAHHAGVLIGHSAGGQLALVSAAGRPAAAVIALAAVCDLTAAVDDDLGDGAVRAFLGGPAATYAERRSAVDPIAQLPTRTPVVLVHGNDDDRVPINQSRAYHQAARAAGMDCALEELPGTDHFDLIDPRSLAFGVLRRALER